MPWKKEKTVLKLRKEFVRLADQPQSNMSQLCQRFNISRKTGYKWLHRWRQEGEQGLQDRSRRPRNCPHRTPERIEKHVMEVYGQYPEWGGRKLRARMRRMARKGQLDIAPAEVPASSTIIRILKRHEKWEPHVYGPGPDSALKRFEREAPNELWQLDFKGEFTLDNQQWCYPLTLIDDHSRFNLALAALGQTRRETVKSTLSEVFERYGLPQALLSDNGPPWGSGRRTADNRPCYTKLDVWFMRLGIRVIHSQPGHPQTHGKNERFNGTLQAELLRYEQFRDLKHAQQRFDWWRNRYNLERPHQSLDDLVPMDCYRPSQRAFPDRLLSVEYDRNDQVRKVGKGGDIKYQGQRYKIGKAFYGYPVAIRPQANSSSKMVYFCQHPIKEIYPTNQ